MTLPPETEWIGIIEAGWECGCRKRPLVNRSENPNHLPTPSARKTTVWQRPRQRPDFGRLKRVIEQGGLKDTHEPTKVTKIKKWSIRKEH